MAKALGLDKDRVHRWARDENLPDGKGMTILQSAGLSIDWILTGHGSMDYQPVDNAVDIVRLIHFLERIESEAAAIRQSITGPMEATPRPVARAGAEQLDPEAARDLTEVLRGASTAKSAETGKRKKAT